MNKLNKITQTSLKTRDLIKQHQDKSSIPGLYEYCEKIQNIINTDEELKGEFTIQDISHFFFGYHIISKSIFEMNEDEFEESIKKYFYISSKTTNYYFRVDHAYKFLKTKKIGNGEIFSFSSLPEKVKKRIKQNYQFENNREPFTNQQSEQYEDLRNNDYYMKITIISRGQDNSLQKALYHFLENKSIFEFFTYSNFREELETSSVYITTNENDDEIGYSYGSNEEKRPYYKEFLTSHILEINKILEKENCNILERNILLTIRMVGKNDSNPDVKIRFLFCVIAMEQLLIGSMNLG